MNSICPNCSNTITENFCAHCGQKKYKRIDKKYILDEVQYTVLHTNKGFLYSIKNIIKNPGKTAREFIDGNRVNHYKPLLLTFVLSGISAFISFKMIGLQEIMKAYYAQQNVSSQFTNDYVSFTSSYNSIIMLLLIPVFAFITKLTFQKWGQNYYEHVVMNAYILSFYTIINIVVVYPILYFFKNQVDVLIPLTSISMLLIPFLLVWFFKEFYPNRPLSSIIAHVLLIILLTFLTFAAFIVFVVLGISAFKMIMGPEAMNYMRSK